MAQLKINKFFQEPVKVIEPDGEIHITNDMCEFYDLRVQIKKLQLEGCVIEFNGETIPINKDGRLKIPKGLFTNWTTLLGKLI